MSKFWLVPSLVATVLVVGCITPKLRNHNWGLPETGNVEGMVETYIDPKNPRCKEERCTFHLHYFIGGKYVKSRPTILFIPGGPGHVVHPQQRDLSFMEPFANVVYFDIRGSGQSQIPASNNYDKYLRARYVVEDIENLRAYLGIEAWDAIYAHSFGTIVAQLYAHKYGKKNEQNGSSFRDKFQLIQPVRVKKLVLSAPVSRHVYREYKRREERIRNLESIFNRYRQGCVCADNETTPASTVSTTEIEGVGDFCFLSADQMGTIKNRLMDIMEGIEDEYGSFRMVSEHYKELSDTDFAISYPFPKAFFEALGTLESHGAAQYDDADLNAKVPKTKKTAERDLEQKTDAEKSVVPEVAHFNRIQFQSALVAAYYTSSNYRALQKMLQSCSVDANENQCSNDVKGQLEKIRVPGTGRFLNFFNPGLSASSACSSDLAVTELLGPALINLEHETSDSKLSLRAYYVFALYDGMSGWLARANGLKVQEDQMIPNVSAAAIATVAERTQNRAVRKHLERIGVVAEEAIRPWNPVNYKHAVPTLVLRGKADPTTVGGQADDFYFKALTGVRILIEFADKGHVLQPLAFRELGAFPILIYKNFIATEPVDSLVDIAFCSNLTRLRAKVRLSYANNNDHEVCQPE